MWMSRFQIASFALLLGFFWGVPAWLVERAEKKRAERERK
jgi:hypothetical protein